MDATRTRRTRDAARQRWYAICRTRRFARLLGFEIRLAARQRADSPPRSLTPS
jgi:hypothetical protein